jgi:hypothetical protein
LAAHWQALHGTHSTASTQGEREHEWVGAIRQRYQHLEIGITESTASSAAALTLSTIIAGWDSTLDATRSDTSLIVLLNVRLSHSCLQLCCHMLQAFAYHDVPAAAVAANVL